MAQRQAPAEVGRLEPVRSMLRQVPVAVTGLVIGGVLFGVIGGVVGLVVGLHAYRPTAWFAVFELGIPAGFVGAVLGMVVGSVAQLLLNHRERVNHRRMG